MSEATQNTFLHNIIEFPTNVRGNKLDFELTNNTESFVNVSDVGNLGNSGNCAIRIDIDF